jgi:hypothetical protein
MNLAESFADWEKFTNDRTKDYVRSVKRSRARLLAAANDNEPADLEIIDIADWQGKPVASREWWLDGLIPARNVTLLSGDGGLGKSLVALQFGIASTIGRSALGLTRTPAVSSISQRKTRLTSSTAGQAISYGTTARPSRKPADASCWHHWPRWTPLLCHPARAAT